MHCLLSDLHTTTTTTTTTTTNNNNNNKQQRSVYNDATDTWQCNSDELSAAATCWMKHRSASLYIPP